MIDTFAEKICEPDFSEWLRLLEENRSNTRQHPLLLSENRRRSLRKTLLDRASAYTAGLALKAGKFYSVPAGAGVNAVAGSAEQALILTGHQPVIYHNGILEKTLLLERFRRQHGVSALNLIMDVDFGDTGLFHYPGIDVEADRPCLLSTSLTLEPAIFIFQRFKAKSQLQDSFALTRAQLQNLNLSEALRNFDRISEIYSSLADSVDPIDLNTIARRCYLGWPGHLEVRLSQLLKLPEIQFFFGGFLLEFEAFAAAYNDELKRYRRAHRIKNTANPFPDLNQESGKIELPFWLLDNQSQERFPLYLARSGSKLGFFAAGRELVQTDADQTRYYAEILAPRYSVLPRAVMLSILMRLELSDLFIHGLGGEHYDRFTDSLLRTFLEFTPPSFVKVSSNRFLFAQQVEELIRFERLQASKREFYFHPEQFWDEPIFAESERDKLKELSADKFELIAEVKRRKQHKLSSAEATQCIKALERQVAAVVDQAFSRYLPETLAAGGELTDVYRFREFPYFFFDNCA